MYIFLVFHKARHILNQSTPRLAQGDELDSGSTPFEPNSQGKQYIPSVCFVFGGSFNAIEKAYRMMKNDTPLVLVEGSKGFATEVR